MDYIYKLRFIDWQAVAKKLHKVDVDVKLLHSSQDSEHRWGPYKIEINI